MSRVGELILPIIELDLTLYYKQMIKKKSFYSLHLKL